MNTRGSATSDHVNTRRTTSDNYNIEQGTPNSMKI